MQILLPCHQFFETFIKARRHLWFCLLAGPFLMCRNQRLSLTHTWNTRPSDTWYVRNIFKRGPNARASDCVCRELVVGWVWQKTPLLTGRLFSIYQYKGMKKVPGKHLVPFRMRLQLCWAPGPSQQSKFCVIWRGGRPCSTRTLLCQIKLERVRNMFFAGWIAFHLAWEKLCRV